MGKYPPPDPHPTQLKKILGKIQKSAYTFTFSVLSITVNFEDSNIYIYIYQKVYKLPLMSSADDHDCFAFSLLLFCL